jgi:hypothetical protein
MVAIAASRALVGRLVIRSSSAKLTPAGPAMRAWWSMMPSGVASTSSVQPVDDRLPEAFVFGGNGVEHLAAADGAHR